MKLVLVLSDQTELWGAWTRTAWPSSETFGTSGDSAPESFYFKSTAVALAADGARGSLKVNTGFSVNVEMNQNEEWHAGSPAMLRS